MYLKEINEVEADSLINFNRVLQAEAVDNCYNPYPNTNRMVDHLYKLVFSKTDKIYSMSKTGRKVPTYCEIKRILDRVLLRINAFNNKESEKTNKNTQNFIEITDDGVEENLSQEGSPAFDANSYQDKTNDTFANETLYSDFSANESNLMNVSKRKSVYENKENQINKRNSSFFVRQRTAVIQF